MRSKSWDRDLKALLASPKLALWQISSSMKGLTVQGARPLAMTNPAKNLPKLYCREMHLWAEPVQT